MKKVKRFLTIVGLCFLLSCVFINAAPDRCELEAEKEVLVYYLESPSDVETYPILLAIEGSYVAKRGPSTVLRLHELLSSEILSWGAALMTLERRGVDGKDIDKDTYHYYNVPSQRLADHLQLVQHIRENPPLGWNGQLIIFGYSEGSLIAISLARRTHPSACVAIAGCGDQRFKKYIWKLIQSMRSSMPWWKRFIISWWASIPKDRAAYNARCDMMKRDPDHKKWWFGATFRYWADALDRCEADDFLTLPCPCLVVAGSEDVECESTDRIVQMAKDNGKDVTYMRVEGMGHGALDPQWKVLDGVRKFLQDKHLKVKCYFTCSISLGRQDLSKNDSSGL